MNISSQFAQLGIKQQRPNLEVNQHLATIEINQPQPEMKITKSKGKLTIDQSAAFADANLKPPLRVAKESTQTAKNTVLQDIASEISEGRRLMKIEKQAKTVIPNIAKEQSQPPQKYSTIKFIPETPEKVKFDYKPSEIDIEIEESKPEIKAHIKSPTIIHHPWNLEIYIKQKQMIDIKVEGSQYDLLA
ncbi:DUF6470 family protein [Bacillus sp. Marseille-P3661]|uniref:DUF6470 family protein n=1 Tax=Bacillus sp. Marseille-P3661 TaxID=1936234 RepID=UPI00115B595D|nr:DUF6470 family protein [Bacillus sp. Marseille-P3661]